MNKPSWWSVWLLAALLCLGQGAAAQAPAVAPAASAPSPPVSLSARKVYEQARSQLVQIRTLLKGPGTQFTVGSGFVVSDQGHIVTNYHVVSNVALEPDRYKLVYVTADGRESTVQVLALDVLHDLALLKAAPRPEPFDVLTFRTNSQPLGQGERMYSLGNPLDVGFAVVEGNYNGLAERSFYPQIFFAGSLNPGMSGGPALDQEGRVIGINVSRQGEQVSFLVPAEFARVLLERGRDSPPITASAWPIVTDQLTTHQALLTDRFMRQGWKASTHPRYTVPVPPDRFMRCWGRSQNSENGGLSHDRSDCQMDTRIFVGQFTTGSLSTSAQAYDGTQLGRLRFAKRYGDRFNVGGFQRLSSRHQTKPQCQEDYVDRDGLSLRVVVCLRAYKKLPGLYDASVLVATLDHPTSGVQGQFDVQGVGYANAMKLTRHYLEAYGWARSH
jgi:hypothetical protein